MVKNFYNIELKKISDTTSYELVEEGIYNDLQDADGFSTHRIAVKICFKNKKPSLKEVDKQLAPYFVYVDKTLAVVEATSCMYVLGGELEDLQNFKQIFIK